MIENLVGLYVKDPQQYQLYREAMTPLLAAAGGGFRYDFSVDQVLKSPTGNPINRLFLIYFPDAEARKNFFADERYQEIRARYFEHAVLHTTLISAYEVPQAESSPAEKTPQDNAEWFHRLIDKIPDVIYRMSLPDGKYQYISPAATAVFGYTPGEFYANPRLIEKVFHPEWLSYFREQWARLLQGEVPPTYEYPIIHKSMDIRWVNQRNLLITDADGRPTAIEGVVTDITDRKRAELDLRESEARYRRLFEANPHPMWVYDLETLAFLAVNEAAVTHYGFSREEFLAMTITDIRPPEDVPRLLDNLIQIGKKPFDRTDVWRHRTKDGSIIEVEITSHYLDYRGRSARLVVAYDVTERKRAENALRESEESLRLALKAANQGLYDLNVQTGEARVSPEYATMLGYDPAEFRETNAAWIERLHPDDREPVAATYRDYIAGRIPEYKVEFRQRTRSGDWKWILSLGQILEWDSRGKPRRMLGTHTEITERKRAEEALRKSESRYRALFEASPQPMWVYDLQTLSFLAVNEAAVVHYGFSREEFRAMTIADIRPPEDVPQLLAIVAQPEEQRIDRSGTWRHRKKDGSIIQVEISSHVLDYQGRRAKLVLVNDVTEHLRAAEEKEKLQAQLLQAQKMESVARLAGGVAHDFNNMLSAILGHAELAMMQCHPTDSIQADLQAIQNAAQRSAQLTRQLLAFARKQTVAPKVLDLNDTVAGLLKMLLRLIGEDIDLVWKPGPGLWPVKMDPSQIDQVLVNLCINARDAITGVGKITIETENAAFDEDYCSLDPDFACGEYVLLAVSDNGCGMGPEVLDRLFEPFFTTKEVGKGTGLGLATVYGIVRQNEGFINVYSEPNRGTTFKIYLPRFAEAVGKSSLPGAAESPRGRGEMVLLVEDEAAILNMGRAMLEGLGYRVLTAGTPGEALRQAEAHAAELKLLITDVVMPEMNGRELAKMLEAIKPGLKCLFTSGYTAEVIAHRGVLDEGVCFLAKPFSINDLAVKARQVLEGR